MAETILIDVPIVINMQSNEADQRAKDRADFIRSVAAGEPASSVLVRQRTFKESLWSKLGVVG